MKKRGKMGWGGKKDLPSNFSKGVTDLLQQGEVVTRWGARSCWKRWKDWMKINTHGNVARQGRGGGQMRIEGGITLFNIPR